MKFKDMPYERPDFEDVKKQLQELNLKLANEEAEYMSQLQDEADLQQIFDALRNKRKKIFFINFSLI